MDKPQKQSPNLFQSVADRLSRFFKKSGGTDPVPSSQEKEQPNTSVLKTEPVAIESPNLNNKPAEENQPFESADGTHSEVTYPRRSHRHGKRKGGAKSIVDLLPDEVGPAIEKYVMDHISDEMLDVVIMAKQLKCSRTVLYQIMHQTFGVTPANYILDLRMKYAEQLLREGSSPKETSMKCGFSDPKYFSKVFKKTYGILPSGYKVSLEENNS